jgi:hypothetical protein
VCLHGLPFWSVPSCCEGEQIGIIFNIGTFVFINLTKDGLGYILSDFWRPLGGFVTKHLVDLNLLMFSIL